MKRKGGREGVCVRLKVMERCREQKCKLQNIALVREMRRQCFREIGEKGKRKRKVYVCMRERRERERKREREREREVEVGRKTD